MKQWVINLMLFSAATVAIGFSLLRVVPFEMTESTYIGIIVTFIGIIVTVLVGYQIYNAIEFKKDIEKQRIELKGEIESRNKEFRNSIEKQERRSTEVISRILRQEKNLISLNNEVNESLHIVLSFKYEHDSKYIACFSALHTSLLYSMYLERDDYTWSLEQLKNSITNFSLMEIHPGGEICVVKDQFYVMSPDSQSPSNIKLSDKVDRYIEPIKEIEKKIRENKEFRVISLGYEPLMKHFYQKVEELKKPYELAIG